MSSSSANLDLVRAVAVLLVLAQHLCRRGYMEQVGWMQTSSWGLFGVLLFFVHTCLVLMYSMERSNRTGRDLITNFAIRRIFRIYPLSISAVLIAISLHLDSDMNGIRSLSHGQFPGVSSAASSLLLVQNLSYSKSVVNVLWSLPLELQMYALLPFLFLWMSGKGMTWQLVCPDRKRWRRLCSALHSRLGRFSILLFIPCFLPGVIAYSLPSRARISSALWLPFILFLTLSFTLRPVLSTGWPLCLVLGLMIPQFREIQSQWLRNISNRIATYSYGIYLSHQFCIWLTLGVLASHSLVLKIPLLAVMLATVPVILYHAIEAPMIKLGSRWANAIVSRKTPSDAFPLSDYPTVRHG